MSNSSLVSYTLLSPNHSGKRTHAIDRITPHCVVGQLSAASICGCFTSPSREASCNYGIGSDGIMEAGEISPFQTLVTFVLPTPGMALVLLI